MLFELTLNPVTHVLYTCTISTLCLSWALSCLYCEYILTCVACVTSYISMPSVLQLLYCLNFLLVINNWTQLKVTAEPTHCTSIVRNGLNDCVIAGRSFYMKCTLTGDKVLPVETESRHFIFCNGKTTRALLYSHFTFPVLTI